jgi:hypothetical protein
VRILIMEDDAEIARKPPESSGGGSKGTVKWGIPVSMRHVGK